MAVSLIESCYELEAIDYWARENLLTKYAISPRKLITIAKSILGEKKYLEVLKRTLQIWPERKGKLPNLFNNLLALNAIYITTNIDDHFSGLFEKKDVHFEQNDFSSSVLKPKNIIHLHGIINNPHSLVLTIDEYVERYQNNHFRKFLEYIFFNEDYCFLFVGYGVDEMEIIDFMIEKYSTGPETLKKLIYRYYILLPFFQNEETLMRYEQFYFDQINMTVIPYAINAKGYDQLNEVIATWREEFEKQGQRDEFYIFNKIIEKNL
ncbi:MAG: SIR2 family protein [Thermodesulfobacteriota bacterium]|jgi:hypothetical protein|nr:MAG: SIR2 family protein [Thermodesulfobacteriota bacterium]